ncbi:MAG: S9 family peptidase [Bdellovibrionota bacterium]|nr:S9 family peptidase [Bdellovibrionota bacterium]
MEPKAKEIEKTLEMHNDVRHDEFYWMRNHPEDPDVLSHLKVENEHVDGLLDKKLREDLYLELKGRKLPNESSVPAKDGAYYYYVRYEKDKEYAIHCRKKTLDGKEEIVLDENKLAEGKEFFSLGSLEISPNDDLMAYSFDDDGSEVFTLFFQDLKTGKLLSDKIENVYTDLVWFKDNKTVLYSVLDHNQRPFAIRKHELGKDFDAQIYEVENPEFFAGIDVSQDQKYIFVNAQGSITNESWFLPSNSPNDEPSLVFPRTRGIEYFPDHHDGKFYVLTNDQHPNFRLISYGVDTMGLENPEEVIPGSDERFLNEGSFFKDFFVLEEQVKGLNEINFYDYTGKRFYSLDFPDEVYSAHLSENYEWDVKKIRYSYSSPKRPPMTMEVEVSTQKKETLKIKEVPNFNHEDYDCKRVWAKGHDGKEIPISLVFKKGSKGPLVLYGYGAYGENIDPSFDDEILPLLDRGFTYAIAHVRGSSTLGRPWYLDGKFFKKKNSFYDFQSAAEYLIQEGYTKKGEICLSGGSAGGLLVCATMNLRPELYKGVIGDVPFVDVVTTMLDKELPLTQMEFEEWGNPEEEAYYKYLKSYSPYDNLEKRDYPHVLLTAGINDPRVTYWEPMKFASRLRKLRTDNGHTLLYTNLGGGHQGPSGRYESLKEVGLQYAFILKIFKK